MAVQYLGALKSAHAVPIHVDVTLLGGLLSTHILASPLLSLYHRPSRVGLIWNYRLFSNHFDGFGVVIDFHSGLVFVVFRVFPDLPI